MIPSLCQHLRSCALVPSPHGFGAVQVHQKSRHFVRQISRSFIERLQFLSNRGAHGAVRCYFCVIDEEAAKGQGGDWCLIVGYVQSCREKLPGAIEEWQKD